MLYGIRRDLQHMLIAVATGSGCTSYGVADSYFMRRLRSVSNLLFLARNLSGAEPREKLNSDAETSRPDLRIGAAAGPGRSGRRQP
jgi:hypothetical protein